jgi:Family of unknown function (DUF6159)
MTYPTDPAGNQYDPYRYGPPAPQPPGQWQPPYPQWQPQPQPREGWSTARATGRQILSASWELLRRDRSMLVLPFLSLVLGLAAAAILFGPGWALGRVFAHSDQAAGWVGGVLAVLGLSIVSIFFQAALVIGANQQADGGTPTLGVVLAAAWSMRGRIISWALVTTTVGLAIRALEQRLGILGRLLGLFAGLAWAIASYLVVPVLVAEGLGPIAAVRRSGALIAQRWGTGLRTTLRWGAMQFLILLPILFAFIAGFVMLGTGTSGMRVVGVLVIAAAVLAFIAASVVFAAISTYAQAMIYRYAVGRPIPIPAEVMSGAFMPKRGRRGY